MQRRKVRRGRAQGSKLPIRALWEAILWLTLVSETCNAPVEVWAKTSSRSPKPLSVLWGHPKSAAQCISPVHACHSPYLPPARFVPRIVVAQTHAPPPREPPQWSARRRPPRSGRDRRRETRCGPRGRTCDVSVLLRGQHLFLPPALLQTYIHSRSPFRTHLTAASEGSKCGVPRLSKSRLQLERPGAQVFPGWRSCH